MAEAKEEVKVEGEKVENETKEQKVTAPKATGAKAKESETVTVNKDVLDNILKELDMLKSISDKSRMFMWDAEHPRKELKRCKLRTFEVDGKDKVIVGWKMEVDEVYKDANGVWHEKQIIRLMFDDKTDIAVNYIDFSRRYKYVVCEIQSKMIDESSGTEVLKVVTADGREFAVDVRFVN